ncbi:MAG: YkvA family protein [Terriglobales bacterium]
MPRGTKEGGWRQAWRRLRREIRTYRLALADPRTPRAAKWILRFVLVYLLSPLDLIPDAIPIIGFIDDAILLPGLLLLARRLIPVEVLADCRARAAATETAGGAGADTSDV